MTGLLESVYVTTFQGNVTVLEVCVDTTTFQQKGHIINDRSTGNVYVTTFQGKVTSRESICVIFTCPGVAGLSFGRLQNYLGGYYNFKHLLGVIIGLSIRIISKLTLCILHGIFDHSWWS